MAKRARDALISTDRLRGVRIRRRREHNRLVLVHEHTPVHVGMNGPCQHLAFYVSTQGDIVFWALRMGDSNNVLLDDGAFIQVGGDEVRGCTDQLHASLEGLLVGAAAFERREERVMDVDDPPRHLLAHFVRQNLHVTGEYDQLCTRLADDAHLCCFSFSLVLLGHLNMVVGNTMPFDHLLEIQVVGDHTDNIDWQGADAPAIQQVVQAMAETCLLYTSDAADE